MATQARTHAGGAEASVAVVASVNRMEMKNAGFIINVSDGTEMITMKEQYKNKTTIIY